MSDWDGAYVVGTMVTLDRGQTWVQRKSVDLIKVDGSTVVVFASDMSLGRHEFADEDTATRIAGWLAHVCGHSEIDP